MGVGVGGYDRCRVRCGMPIAADAIFGAFLLLRALL
jgi:hypothetical protein